MSFLEWSAAQSAAVKAKADDAAAKPVAEAGDKADGAAANTNAPANTTPAPSVFAGYVQKS